MALRAGIDAAAHPSLTTKPGVPPPLLADLGVTDSFNAPSWLARELDKPQIRAIVRNCISLRIF
jgi:hypothetical protein